MCILQSRLFLGMPSSHPGFHWPISVIPTRPQKCSISKQLSSRSSSNKNQHCVYNHKLKALFLSSKSVLGVGKKQLHTITYFSGHHDSEEFYHVCRRPIHYVECYWNWDSGKVWLARRRCIPKAHPWYQVLPDGQKTSSFPSKKARQERKGICAIQQTHWRVPVSQRAMTWSWWKKNRGSHGKSQHK